MEQKRTEGGKFAPKSEANRSVKSLRLTEATWEALGAAAESKGMTRADLIEQLTADGVVDQVAKSDRASLSISQVESAIERILEDPNVTRNGKDRGAVRRALQALLSLLA